MLLEESLKTQGKKESVHSLAVFIENSVFLKHKIFDSFESYDSDVLTKFSLI
jgi:hypothetical protein